MEKNRKAIGSRPTRTPPRSAEARTVETCAGFFILLRPEDAALGTFRICANTADNEVARTNNRELAEAVCNVLNLLPPAKVAAALEDPSWKTIQAAAQSALRPPRT